MTLRLLIVSVFFLVSTAALAEPDERMIEGRSYVRVGLGWEHVGADGQRFTVDPSVITVKFRAGIEELRQSLLNAAVGGTVLRRARTGFIDIEISAGEDPLEVVESYRTSGLVQIAEPNTFGEYTVMPNDPLYGSQWHLPIISAEMAWDITSGAPTAVVAVLDSGTEFTHEDLGTGPDAYQNVWLNDGEDAWSDPADPTTGNGIDDDLNGFADDWKGWDFDNGDNDPASGFFHGTAVAGTVAAKTDNDIGVAGVAGGWNAPGARLLLVGVGEFGPNGSILDEAIIYAAENGADVIQLSLTVGQTAAIDAALQMAHDDYDVTIVCSSGNGGSSSVGYPSSDSHVIAVGATDQSDLRASFSNHGPDVEISAPGVDILMPDLNNSYGTSSGTSFSSPIVSGIVALMRTVNPGLANTAIRQILHDTADKVGGYNYNWDPGTPGHSFELGYGRANALLAIEAVDNVSIFSDGFESGDTSAWSGGS